MRSYNSPWLAKKNLLIDSLGFDAFTYKNLTI